MKILVIDDNPVILKLMVNLLERQEGHIVKTACDGLTAIDILRDFVPKIIFIDMIMPKISGDKLCRIIRGMPHLVDVYLVILSGLAAEENFDYQSFGANACIAKGLFLATSRHILEVLTRLAPTDRQADISMIYGQKDLYHRQETQELLASKRHVEIILGNISDGILECTTEAMIVYANPLAAVFFRQQDEIPLLSTSLFDYFQESSRPRIARLIEGATSEPRTIGEDEPLILYGRMVSLSCLSVQEDEQRFILVILRDITERKGYEEELRHNYRTQAAISELLQLSLEDVTLGEILEQFLEKLASFSWIGLAPSGAVFLAGHQPGILSLRAHHGVPENWVTSCTQMSFGHCLRGLDTTKVEPVYVDGEDDNLMSDTDINKHGRYFVPILSVSQRQLGVFAVSLQAGYGQDQRVEEVLIVVARVLADIIDRISAAQQLWESEQNYRAFAQIGLALSGEKDNDRLLEMIVDAARLLSKADGGTLYIVEPDGCHLRFAILQNDTMKTRLRGTDSGAVFPQVPLYQEDGRPNYNNVASYVALTDQIVNIPDVYEAANFDFTGPRRYDLATGYRSKSMLVIALKNHMNEIIGVLQLINALDLDTGEVIAFADDYVKLVSSLASQAAMSLTNIQLVKDQQNLFYAFIQSIATAIDEKSPYTGGHIRRVFELTMMIAEKINETEQGPFGQVRFSAEEMEELRLAAWMHDVGKITTPDYVVDKADKLQTIFSRIRLVETRFGLIIQQLENEFLRHKIALIENGDKTELSSMEAELNSRLLGLKEDMAFIKECNLASEFMSDDKIARIKAISAGTYIRDGEEHPYLSADEVENLCIRKGNLNEREQTIIDNHATMTSKILNQLPFPKNLAMVPNYAGGHHEKLNGSGYPLGLTEDQLPLQVRILAIADIFEALTAKDRPYREPMRLSQAIRIMEFMKKDCHIDSTIFDLFVESGLCRIYATKEMKPEQIDS